MPPDVDRDAGASRLLHDLSPEEEAEFERRSYVRKGDECVWREPGGAVRREKLASLYYLRTASGVFRVSCVTGEVVEV